MQIKYLDSQELNTADLEKQIMLERQNELNELEKDINLMNGMMVDVADMINKQGEHLDIIEDDIDNTNQQI